MGSTTALWLAGLSIVALIAWRETKEVFDDALKESGYLIMAATTDWSARGLHIDGGAPSGSQRKLEMQYQIVVDGKVVQRTTGAPTTPYIATFTKTKGFANVMVDEKEWRVFVARSVDQRSMVQVGQEYEKRCGILREFADHLVVPAAILLLLLGLASWFFIRRVTRPISDMATDIAQKSRDDLSLLSGAGQPVELRPIIDAVNGMLGRLDAAIQAEQRFTADAAHELRTPLAGVQMHVQLLQRQHPGLAGAFQKLRHDVERSSRLVDGLLTLARLDPIVHHDLMRSSVVLAPLLDETLRTHQHRVAKCGATIVICCGRDVVYGNADMLSVVLRNLVDNALRYGGPGCKITISAERKGERVRLSVCDDGPGVPAADRARLTERFFRILGSGQGGSGLGLSIVKRIVELHRASLQFSAGPEGAGLAVLIDFLPTGAVPSSALRVPG